MAKKKPRLPKIFSKPILWTGPSEFDRRLFFCKSKSDAFFGFLFWGTQQEFDERKRKIGDQYVSAIFDVTAKKLEKMVALAEHYGIKTTNTEKSWSFELCMKLCDEYVPGFQVKYEQTAGRPTKWHALEYSKLLLRVEKLKLKNVGTARAALKQILIENGITRPSSAEIRSLETKLSEAHKPKHNPLCKLIKPEGAEDRLQYLEEVVSILSEPKNSLN